MSRMISFANNVLIESFNGFSSSLGANRKDKQTDKQAKQTDRQADKQTKQNKSNQTQIGYTTTVCKLLT